MKILLKIFLVYFAFISISNVYSLQKNKYYGRVSDKNSGEPLIGVNVYTEDGKFGTESDADGYFYLEFPTEYSDAHYVIFQYMGYETQKNKLVFNKAQEIMLPPLLLNSPDSVRIVADKFDNDMGLSHQYIQPMKVKNFAAVGDPDIFRYIASQSGVSFTNDVSNKIYIRGMRSDKLFIMFDDFVLYNPYHLVSITSSIDIGAVSTVELYKSLYPVDENGRTGGMLKIYSKKGNSKQYRFDITMSLMSSILRAEGPVPVSKGSFMVSLRRTYIDFLSNLFTDEFPYSFYDGVFKINFNPKKHRIEISGIKSYDFFENSSENSKWSNGAMGVNWKYYYSPRLYFHNSLSFSEYRSSFYQDTLNTLNDINHIALKSNLFYQTGLLNSLFQAGFALHSFNTKFKSDFEDFKLLEDRAKSNQADIFLNIDGDLSQKLKFNCGLSGVYFSSLPNAEILPLFRLSWLISDSLKIAAGYAKKAQFLATVNNEKDDLPPFNIWRTIDENTGAEIARQTSFSIQLLRAQYNFNIEFYYNYLSNIVDFNRHYIDEEDPLFLSNRGESYGLELNFNYFNSYFSSNVNYSLSRTIYSMFNKTYYPSFHRRHKVNININSKSFNGWTFSLHWVFSSGRPYTIKGGYYDLNYFEQSIYYSYPHVSTATYSFDYNSAFYPSYHRLDIHINKKISARFRLFFDIINLYNKKNVLYYEYDPYNGKSNVVTMLPILPNIGFEYKF